MGEVEYKNSQLIIFKTIFILKAKSKKKKKEKEEEEEGTTLISCITLIYCINKEKKMAYAPFYQDKLLKRNKINY